MKSAVLLALVWSVTLFAGCHALDGGGGDDPDPTTSPTATETPTTTTTTTTPTPTETEPPEEEPVLDSAVIVNHTTEANEGEELNVTWELRTTTGETVQVEGTGISWSDEPFAPEDAPNATTTISRGPVDAPGTFNATFTSNSSGTFYVRAFGSDGDIEVWSDIIEIEVKESGSTGGTTHIVSIGAKVVTAGGQTFKTGQGSRSFFEPQSLQIALGDSVVWKNEDPEEAQHTATDCPDPAAQDEPCSDAPRWDTSTIGGGAESAPIVFTTAGTYNYYCKIHPDSVTMGKTTASENEIVVAAPS